MTIWADKIKPEIENLYPGYFALVMATGIISLASHYFDAPFVARALLWMNVGFYIILWILCLARMTISTSAFFSDFADFSKGPGYFTVIAGNCVLGNQFAVILNNKSLAAWFLYFGIALWLLILYPVFLLLIVKPEKPPLDEGINGSWLVAIVATQSISILSASLSSHFPLRASTFLFISTGFFSAGLLLYLLVITLIFYRWIYFKMPPDQMDPTYWINMGALAISTVAAALLAQNSSRAAFLESLHPVLAAGAIMLWASATWWIPLQALLGLWKYPYSGERFSYSPKYWSMVFPLGMYTACTYYLSRVTGLDFVLRIAYYFYFIAGIAWMLTFLGVLNNLRKIFFSRLS